MEKNKKKMDKKEILKKLSRLNDHLKKEEKKAEILVCGGASMALLFDDNTLTIDIDAIISPAEEKAHIRKYVKLIAKEEELEEDWLNDAAAGFIDKTWGTEEVEDFGNLKVYSVKAEQLLAMKIRAGRKYSRDQEDAITLMKELNINTVEDVFDVVEENIPSRVLTGKMQFFAMETFEEYQKEFQDIEDNVIKIQIPEECVNGHKITLPKNTKLGETSIGGYEFECQHIDTAKFREGQKEIVWLKDQSITLTKEENQIEIYPTPLKDSLRHEEMKRQKTIKIKTFEEEIE